MSNTDHVVITVTSCVLGMGSEDVGKKIDAGSAVKSADNCAGSDGCDSPGELESPDDKD